MIPSPLQAAIGALVVDAGNAVVAFGAFNNTVASVVETAVIGLVSVAFIVASELRHRTITQAITASKTVALSAPITGTIGETQGTPPVAS